MKKAIIIMTFFLFCFPGMVFSADKVVVIPLIAESGCPDGLINCSNTCTDVKNNPSHCGNCNTSCSNLPNVSTAYCSDGACRISSCESGWAHCDTSISNGCELYLGNVSNAVNTCLTAEEMAHACFCGDTGSDTFSVTGTGTKWFKLLVQECNASPTLSNHSVTFTLTSPDGIHYDMIVLEGSCSGDQQPAVGECVPLAWVDTLGDDFKTVYILVYYVLGQSCESWTLTANGNTSCN